MGCDGLHCDGCRHGGGPAAAVIVLLIFIALGVHAEWHAIVHIVETVVEIVAWSAAGMAGAAVAVTGGVFAARTIRSRRARSRAAYRPAGYQVIPAARLIERASERPAIEEPKSRPGGSRSWPLPGWWEEIRPGIGSDRDDRRSQ